MSIDETSFPDDSAADRPLCLDQFLKLSGIADTGGRAKWLIQNGEVRLNGAVETRRRKKLFRGDVIEVGSQKLSADPFL